MTEDLDNVTLSGHSKVCPYIADNEHECWDGLAGPP